LPGGKEGFRGDLLRWARIEKKQTLREVQVGSGLSFSYLCELERGTKREIRSEKLSKVVRYLGITEAFARGHVPCFKEEPRKCRGLAAEVGAEVLRDFSPDLWTDRTTGQRCTEVIRRIVETPEMPKLVLAYVLGISLDSLEGFLMGEFAVPPVLLVERLSELTTLPMPFFRHGLLHDPPTAEKYRGAFDEIQRQEIPLEELWQWLRSRG
jgi:transcriptional regulator with XRE-family HTH domain